MSNNDLTMRELITLYEKASADEVKKAIRYYNSTDELSDKERIDHMVPVELKGKAQNPNNARILGPDQNLKATKDFTDGDKLNRIDQIRKMVEVLQRMSHKAELNLSEDDMEKVDSVIEKLNKEADELSSSLVDVV